VIASWILVAAAWAADTNAVPASQAQVEPVVETFAPLEIAVSGTPGRELVTVVGSNVPLDRLLARLATAVGRELEGIDDTMRPDLVTVELRERPLAEVLEICLGAVGLRAEVSSYVIRVRSTPTTGRTPTRLREAAMATYARGLNGFSDHPDAPLARLSQAAIEETNGNLGAAVEHYHALIETFRTSPEVHTARWRMALALQRLGLWAEASAQLRTLASHAGAEELHGAARLELARCALELGNPVLAQNMLEALDRTHPVAEREVRADRELLKARTHLAQEDALRALQVVEAAAARGWSTEQEMEAMWVRARAFEYLALPKEAARAWLILGVHGPVASRPLALERSARLSLEANDELASLFVAAIGRKSELADAFEEPSLEARRRLGLELDVSSLEAPLRLELVEEYLREDRLDEATPLLETLHAERVDLEHEQFIRLARLRAAHTNALVGVDAALDVLRDARWELEDREDRQPLDMAAAELLERARRYDRAFLAYEGIY
jgi:hypothetical protein